MASKKRMTLPGNPVTLTPSAARREPALALDHGSRGPYLLLTPICAGAEKVDSYFRWKTYQVTAAESCITSAAFSTNSAASMYFRTGLSLLPLLPPRKVGSDGGAKVPQISKSKSHSFLHTFTVPLLHATLRHAEEAKGKSGSVA